MSGGLTTDKPSLTPLPGLGEDTGPHPAVRAVTGLLLGLGVGLISALLLPRHRNQGPPTP